VLQNFMSGAGGRTSIAVRTHSVVVGTDGAAL